MDGATAQLAYAANGPATGAQTTQNTATGGGQAGTSAQSQSQPDGESAANPNQPTGGGEGEGAAENPTDSGTENRAQLSEKVPIEQAISGTPTTGSVPASAPGDASATLTPSGQIAGKVTLAGDDAPAVAGIIVRDGLKYEVLANGTSVKLVGAASAAPAGDIAVPSTVTGGNDTFAVVAVGSHALATCADATSVTLPASVRDVAPDAFDGCPSLASIEVAAASEHFSSLDGMLFDKAGAKLVRCPEGKRGVAVLPASATDVSPQAFAGCAGVTSVAVTSNDGESGEGGDRADATAGERAAAGEGEPAGSTASTPAFATFGGALYTGDLTTLVFCPAGIGTALVLPAETEVIGPQALAGCANLASVTPLGTVRTIDPTAFADETKAAATVALPAGEDYAARKAVWEVAGFRHFAEPAQPGATARPETTDSQASASGFVFTLLADYTLAVAWEGAEDPAAHLEIPASAEISGVSYRVSTIAPNAFANRAALETVNLPAAVATIGEAAFAGCANLASVELPAALQTIGERAFEATALTYVWLPASIATIGPRAFANCEALTRIVAPGTPEVADDALAGCANLSVYCPYSAEGTYPWNLGLLANNNHLMPYGLTLPEEPLQLEVGQQANLFEGALCESPEPTDLTFSYAATPLSVDQTAQVTAKAPGTSEVTATLTLDAQELARATRTVEVTVPAPETPGMPVTDTTTPESLEAPTNEPTTSTSNPAETPQMLTGTMNLSSVAPNPLLGTTFEQQTPAPTAAQTTNDITPLAANDPFEQGKDGTWFRYTITKADASTNTYEVSVGASADAAKKPEGSVVVPDQVTNNDTTYTVTSVTSSGFAGCSNLRCITLPETVKIIESLAFNQSGLSETPVMPGVQDLRVSAFRDCDNLQEFTVPPSVEYMGVLCFELCSNLRKVVLPDTIKGMSANNARLAALFVGCYTLETIELGSNSLYKLVDGALYSKDGTSLIDTGTRHDQLFEVSSGTQRIEDSSIKDREGIQGVVLPSSVTEVLHSAFRGYRGSEILCLPPAGSQQIDSAALTSPWNGVSMTNVAIYCSDPAAWEGNEGTTIKHDVGLPASYGVPSDGGATTLSTNLSIPEDSLFANNIEVRWTYSEGAEKLATFTPSADGRILNIAPITQAPGTFTATASMVYIGANAGENGTVLATGQTTVTVAPSSGALPSYAEGANSNTDVSDESLASWKLENGVLDISCTPGRVIKDLGWYRNNDSDQNQSGYWGDLRPLVKKVVMTPGLKAESMALWFMNMTELVDASGVFIPEGVTSVDRLFANCQKLTSLPEGFTIPASVETTLNMFIDCFALKTLPSSFAIPANSKLTVAQGMFAQCYSLEYLPDGVVLPDTLTGSCQAMFQRAGIRELPARFTIPKGAERIDYLLYECRSLECLPENFAIPTEATGLNMTSMFYECSSLTSLPKNFTMPESTNTGAMFACSNAGSPLPLYYAGTDTALTGKGTAWWTAQNRVLVTPSTTGQVQFQVPSATAPDQWETVTAFVPNASGLMPEPAAPARVGQVFTLWYTDQDCKQRYDFGKSLVENGVEAAADGTYQLYGRYAAAATGNTATSSGALPTVDNQGSAWWSLGKVEGSEGRKVTLYLRGTGKVADFGWKDIFGDFSTTPAVSEYWGVFRVNVNAIAMQPSFNAEATDYWFRNMTNLTDFSQGHLPQSATSLKGMFQGDNSLTSLPEGLSLPAGSLDASYLFADARLTSLPASFTLPSTLQSAQCLLRNNPIQQIPDGFLLPSSIKNASFLFQNTKVTSLPDGFTIPSGGVNVTGLFLDCSQLSALPEGFSVPADIQFGHDAATDTDRGMQFMFNGCNKLTYFPESFDFPADIAANDATSAFPPFYVDPATTTTPLPTYYSGTNEAVLTFDWASQNRVLITDPAGRGHKVTYKLANDDGTWKTYATVLTDAAGIVPQLAELQSEKGFTGWSADPDCLEPFDFATPATSDVTVYGKRFIYGGRDKAVGEGQLPVDPDTGEAWWQITNDGTLMILGDGKIQNLGWSWEYTDISMTQHWGAHRGDVKSILMSDNLRAYNINAWFQRMDNLRDISGVRIPGETTAAVWLFFRCTQLDRIPDGFDLRFPETCTNWHCLFGECNKLSWLPEGFTIPEFVTKADQMFKYTALTSVPESFVLHDRLKDVSLMFEGCAQLTSLSNNFRLVEGNAIMYSMFINCTSLTALPEGFTIPNTATNVRQMFSGCISLTSLPASLDLRNVTASGKDTMFALDAGIYGENPLVTYYAGNIENLKVSADVADAAAYWRTTYHRDLVSAVPSNRSYVSFFLSGADGTYGDTPWTKALSAEGGMVAELAAPPVDGKAFAGWYTDPTCTKLFDFTKSLAENGLTKEPYALYGAYATASGALPTESDAANTDPTIAGWHLTTDGTLSIWNAPGEVIAPLWHDSVDSPAYLNYWGPLRSSVKRVVMDETIKTSSLLAWFCEMPQLVDGTGIFIPEGTKDLWRMFHNCSALVTLPSDFAIPNGAENLRSMFRHCASLKQLPSGFTLPSSVNNVYAMLEFSGIESLPAGFSIPETVTDVGWMLSNCVSLKSLPESFKIPENATEAPGLFYACSSLTSLPSSFKIPGSMQNAASMFEHCRSLSSLPEGFKFENPSVLTNVSHLFKDCYSLTSLPSSFVLTGLEDKVDPAKPIFTTNNFTASTPLTTYYAGDDLTSLSVVAGSDAAATSEYWLQKHHRKLVSKNDSLPEGFKKVSFKTRVVSADEVASPILNWDDFTTIVTDATGTFRAPAAPVPYGYGFDGWYKDPECTIRFIFDADGSASVSADTVLYGKLVMRISFDAPTSAVMVLDASGAIQPALAQVKSYSAVPLAVSTISCTKMGAAEQLIDAVSLDKTKIVVRDATDPDTSTSLTFGTEKPTGFTLPASTSASAPGTLNLFIQMNAPPEATYTYVGDGLITDLARLTFQVRPM
ncbi:MAG TPA: leucine-rich repeat protein [Candidatus Gordonibacter avicola]|nr:leucine-rich repeat protein [Candidatus Gordonibacter avicola]